MNEPTYEFTYSELKPLLDILWKEVIPPEDYFSGINAIMDRLMQIKSENEQNELG